MRFLLGLLLTLGFGSVAARANAGCPNVCDMTVTMPEVTPPLPPCATVKTFAEDCDCGVRFQLLNSCDAPIETSGFEFDICWNTTTEQPCTAAQPDQFASIETPLGVTGHQDYSYTLVADDGRHEVTFSTEVTSFDDGCVCTLPGARGGGSRWAWLVAGAIVLVGRRRLRFC
jgi:hypothetical protein